MLPIDKYADAIVRAVKAHRVVIVSAETGAGKSTGIPPVLHAAGFSVMVTQPRRLAARTVAERVAQQMGVTLGTLVGYRTGEDAKDSATTEILFCTDGLQLVHELRGRNSNKKRVLVIDEVHEWNVNQEVLVAYCKRELEQDPDLRVVLMSATIDDEALSRHFDGAPVVKVPGRLYPVDMRHDSSSRVESVVADLVREGRNVLVFADGKAEIAKMIEKLQWTCPTAVILPLHGQMTAEEQRAAFQHYEGRQKIIVATNVAQTSITIDDINAVVDTGTRKTNMVMDGVEGLYLSDISQADCKQRAGRAGRTSPGIYVLCSPLGLSDRPEFPTPEIKRVRLDQLVLRLAAFGLKAEELDFLHKPDAAAIRQARASLGLLGALDSSGAVTSLGRKMSSYPLSVQYARMLVEARERDVEGPVATIVACLEAGGILQRDKGCIPRWHKMTSQVQKGRSDLLAQLDVFRGAAYLPRHRFNEYGVNPKQFSTAKKLLDRMTRNMGDLKVDHKADYDVAAVLMACLSGCVETIYTQRPSGYYYNTTEAVSRKLDDQSVVSTSSAIVAGTPFDLEYQTADYYGEAMTGVHHLLNNISVVEMHQLRELWPHLAREASRTLAEAILNDTVSYPGRSNNEWIQSLRALRLCEVPKDRLMEALLSKLDDATSEAEIQELDLTLVKEDFLPAEIAAKLNFGPRTITVEGFEVQVDYTVSSYTGVNATLKLPMAAIKSLDAFPTLDVARLRVEAVDDSGTLVASGYTPAELKEALAYRQRFIERQRQWEREQEVQRRAEEERDERIAAAVERIVALRQKGVPVDSIERKIYEVRWMKTSAQLGLLREIEKIIDKLETTDPVQAFLDDMLRRDWTGSIRRLLRETAAAAIRSNGFFERLTNEAIRDLCMRRIEELDIVTADQLDRQFRYVVPQLSDYVDPGMLAELKRTGELAPSEIEISGRKGVTNYPVTYDYEERSGENIAVGRISLPLSVYEHNAAEYGKESALPVLPYGILLVVEVTREGKIIASGVDGPELQGKLKKYKRGQNRSRNTIRGTEIF